MDWRIASKAALALALGLAGALLFVTLELPLPWMLGALSACLLAAVVRLPVARPDTLTTPMRIILGLAVGSAFTPALMARVGEMAGSLAFVVPSVIIAGLIGVPFFRHVAKFDLPTAFFASMPGGFQDMIAMGRDAGADERRLSLVHSTRVLIIVFALPFWIEWSEGVTLGGRTPETPPLGDIALGEAGILAFCGVAGWWLAKRLGISGAAIVGPMFLSGLVHVTGLVTARVPMELINLAQLVLGAHAGCQFFGVTAREFVGTVSAAIVYTLMLLAMAAGIATCVITLTDIAPAPVALAFSPGGQAEMTVMAVVLASDVAYVALHHLFRLALVIVGAQLVFHRLNRRGPPATT